MTTDVSIQAARRHNLIALGSFLLLLLLLLWMNYRMVAPYLLAVLMGGILALLSRGNHQRLQRRGLGPRLAAGIVTLGVWLLIVVPVCFFVVMAVTQGIETARGLTDQGAPSLGNFSQKITRLLPGPVRNAIGNASAVEEELREGLKKLAAAAPAVLFKVFGGLPEFVLQFFLGMLSCYFLLLDGGRFTLWLRDKLPLDPEVRGAIYKSFRDTAASTTVAMLTAASCQSIIIVIGFLLLGAPVAFLAGGLTFVLAWIPLLGSTPVWTAAALYFFLKGMTLKGFLMLGVGALTGISDNIVYPLVLKGRASMHPLVSLVAIFGGIQLFGIFGVFVGPILAAMLVATLNLWPIIAERFGILKACQIVTGPEQALVSPVVEIEKPGIVTGPLTQEPA